MDPEAQIMATVDAMANDLVDALVAEGEENVPVTELAQELIATMGDRSPDRKLLMMATSLAAALKIIAVAKRNTPPQKRRRKQ